jgi:hypothetical protein
MPAKPETVQQMEDRLRSWNAWWWAQQQAKQAMFPSTLNSDRKHMSPLGGAAVPSAESRKR